MSNATKARPRPAPSRSSTRSRSRSRRRQQRRHVSLLTIVVGGAALLALIAVLVTWATHTSKEQAGLAQTRPVTVTGTPLVALPDSGPDPAVGVVAPVLAGQSFDGTPVSIGADGTPKLVVYMAHWCPHCRRELPDLVQWLKTNAPSGLAIYAVSTGANPDLVNYPPSRWLEGQGWTWPVLADDTNQPAAVAYGMPGTPFYVALDGAGHVRMRRSGEVGTAGFADLVHAATATS